MKRRAFVAASLVALPVRARAAVPIVGFLRSTPSAPFARLVAAFRKGLEEGGLVEGRSVEVEYRWADNQVERLPALALELVHKPVAVIVGNSQAAEVAKAATSTTPIVFVTSDDPVARGLVASLSRPGGNVTGVTFFGAQLGAKRLELMLEILPSARTTGVLVDPTWPGAQAELRDVEEAARRRGLRVVTAQAATAGSSGPAIAGLVRDKADILLVLGSPRFTSSAHDIAALAAQYKLPAAYDQREFVAAGGLLSYSGSFTDAYREAGVYAARIVKGARPSDLPVLQPSTFALTLNLRTAKSLGLEVPRSVLLRSDEIIT